MRLGSRTRRAPVLTERGRLFRGVGFAIAIQLALLCVIVFFARPSCLGPTATMSEGGEPQTTAGGLYKETQ